MATTKANDPSTRRKEFEEALPRWMQVEDAAAGEAAVKAKKQTYLPQPNAHDTSEENQQRYAAYLTRALYYNATGRTEAGLIGLAFGKPPEVQVPAPIEPMLDDIDGGGVKLVQQAQQALSQILKTGRCGLLVDHPPTLAPVSRADQARDRIQPTIALYPASAIVNWRTERRGGKHVTTLVVLQEVHETRDGFATSYEDQYRVLILEQSYRVELWRKIKTATGEEWAVAETYVPLDGQGREWMQIPFAFVGAKNNDTTIDDAPLYDLSCVNLAHYRNSADYEESVYVIGQPQYWVMGVTPDWIKIWKEQGIYFGARAIGAGPQGATVQLLQPSPNTLAKEAMATKENQMAALGARLIQPGTVAKTATQQDSEDEVAQSVLSLCCDNVSDGYTQALTWFCAFAKTEGKPLFAISTDFTTRVDPGELESLIKMIQQGLMPKSALWDLMRRAGKIDAEKTDDQLREEIEAEVPEEERTDLRDEDETRRVA